MGIRPDDVDVLGHLDDVLDPLGRRVSCFVGRVDLTSLPPQVSATPEVDELLLVSLAQLRGRAPRAEGTPPRGYEVTGYESRTLGPGERVVRYWRLQGPKRPAVLWGFTAGLIGALLERAFAWVAPRQPTVVKRWEDLQP